MTYWYVLMRLMHRRPPRDRCTICGGQPVVMSGTVRDVYGTWVHLGACGAHNRRLDYALYLASPGDPGEVIADWLNGRIDASRFPDGQDDD